MVLIFLRGAVPTVFALVSFLVLNKDFHSSIFENTDIGWKRQAADGWGRSLRLYSCFMELCHFFTFPHGPGDKLTRKEQNRTYWSPAKSRTEPLRASNPQRREDGIGTSPPRAWRTPRGAFVSDLTGPLGTSLQPPCPPSQVFHKTLLPLLEPPKQLYRWGIWESVKNNVWRERSTLSLGWICSVDRERRQPRSSFGR